MLQDDNELVKLETKYKEKEKEKEFNKQIEIEAKNKAHQEIEQREKQRQKEQLDQKFKEIHEAFNNIPDLNLAILRTIEEEIQHEIDIFKDRQFNQITDVDDYDALMLAEPKNKEQFNQALIEARHGRDEEVAVLITNETEPSVHYYQIHITSIEDIHNHLRRVYELEKQRHFRIAFDFGFIAEIMNYTDDGELIIEYAAVLPRNNLSPLNIKSIIKSEQDIENYQKYLLAKVIDNQDFTLESTKKRYIAIFSMVIAVYRLPPGGKACPELQKFVKRKEIHYVDSPYQTNCVAEALSFFTMPDTKEKRYNNNERVAEGVRLTLLIQSILGNQIKGNSARCDDVKQFLQTYQGFDFAAHGQQVAKFFNINFCIYAYRQNKDGDSYFLDSVIKPKDIDSETVNEEMDEDLKDVVQETQEAKDFNILMLHFENWVHILYISDPIALTGYRYCPICKEHAVPVKNKNCNAARDFERHVTSCRLNKGKQVVLKQSLIPFASHITGNKTYEYLLSHDQVDKFKPTRYYITYDFEAFDKYINKEFGKGSYQHSIQQPFSVAMTIKTKESLKTKYFDIRSGPNFIEQFIEEVFDEAKQVYEDNKYDDPNIPYEIPVPVLDAELYATVMSLVKFHQDFGGGDQQDLKVP
ncbi:MAG: hypothetical protein EZS28_028080 [Streblomastix strix]|uniref:Uncharacterized protein n=1 Tax=Streblomastix strix TaxID=222440 RepID=A0A5J4V1Q2_9EUKA|nr:MAG: hypothetical protein EZS28_028080 [Streblomastix strix]